MIAEFRSGREYVAEYGFGGSLSIERVSCLLMSDHHGFVYHPQTGGCIARVENGKVVGVDGRS